MHTPKLALLGLAVALATSAQAVVLVNDQFNDTDRIGGFSGSSTTTSSPSTSTPTSTNTQWISSATSMLVASSSGQLLSFTGTGSRSVNGYFPMVTLAAGTTTTFTLNFRTGNDGTAANNLRIALTDASPNGTRSTDGIGATDATYVNDVGYGFFSNTNVGAGGTTPLTMSLRERTLTTSNNLLGTAGEWTAFSTTASPTGFLQANTDYSLSIGIAYDGSQNSITASITGGNLTGLSYTAADATPVTQFSSLVFRLGSPTQWTNINFTSFSVTQVPEPSTYAALAGVAALGFAAWRRRRS